MNLDVALNQPAARMEGRGPLSFTEVPSFPGRTRSLRATVTSVAKDLAKGMGGFLLGAVVGLGLWWLVWNPGVDLGLLPPPTTREGDTVTIDLFGFLGKWIGLFVLPIIGGVFGAKALLGRV